MKNTTNQKITLSAMFAAIICVVTLFIKIPIPATNGYIHPGDGFVILSGLVLGPFFGAAAAGIGGMLADVLGGYIAYAPVTFFVKAFMAVAVKLVFDKMVSVKPSAFSNVEETHKAQNKHDKIALFAGVLIATLINVAGYFCYEWILYKEAALVSVIWNIVQGISGGVITFILYPLVKRIYVNVN